MAVDSATRTAYAVHETDDKISVLDAVSHSVTPLTVGVTPWRVAIDSEAGVALVTTYQRHDTVAIVDTTRRELVATIPVGDQPTEIAIDTSSHVAYILNTSDNTVSIIDIGKRTATATIGVGKKPQNLAVDPSTHTAYVTNAGDGTRLDHRALKQPNGTGPRHGPG